MLAPLKHQMLNGWVDITSTSTGTSEFRRLISMHHIVKLITVKG